MDTPRRMLVLGLVLCLALGMLAALLMYTRTTPNGATLPANGEQRGSSPWFVIMIAVLTATLVPIVAYASRRGGGSSAPRQKPKHKQKRRVVQREDGDSFEVVDDDR